MNNNKQPSNFALYIAEREGRLIVEDDRGFATYSFHDNGLTCYIGDIFVRKEYRKQGVAAEYADHIADLARKEGAKILLGSVDSRANGATASREVLKAYGMSFLKIGQDGLELYWKEIA